MIAIKPEDLLRRIAPQRLCYSMEYLDLSSPEMREKWAIACFSNHGGTCFAVVWQSPGWSMVNFIGCEKNFCKALLSRFKTANIAFVVPPGKALQKVRIHGLKPKRTFAYESFARETPAPEAPIDPRIRLLAKEEYDLVRPIVKQKEDLADECTVRAWLENGSVLGYISCSPCEGMADIWDVNYIFTLPEYRGRGIATALAYAYLKDIREQGLVPYYSGVSNPASAAAARKAGFTHCCTRYAFNYKRPKLRL